ncbi:MAG TPA: DUF3857 domain-containing protein [Blastocatellia bacterium]|nr:DUF3857 domain-containing protein [Blastocatellia bacterium]
MIIGVRSSNSAVAREVKGAEQASDARLELASGGPTSAFVSTLRHFGLGLLFATLLCGWVAASGHARNGGRAPVSDDAPDWLKAAAAAKLSAYDKSVPAVVLLNEETRTVDAEGKITKVFRRAVKILTVEGKRSAIASEAYITDTEKVRDMQAWMIRPSGAVKHFRKDDVADVAAVDDDIYNEVRAKVVLGEKEADPGAVFGFETTLESKSVFTQFDWQFQDAYPVLASRVTLNLPSGWTAESTTFNHAKIEPSVSASAYKWELTDLPFLAEEPLSPAPENISPRVAVSYFPPDSARKVAGRSFSSWEDVSRWISELSDPQIAANDALTAKAQSLAASAHNQLDRIKAIGTYVQAVRYVSIQTGEGRGGGYRPHAATEVFAKSYGDCKDKANLMRAMLKAVGIVSYSVGIYSGDPYYVHKDWASPQQFNHCIIAIKVDDDTKAQTIITHPSLGRLLIFDPTDPYTPVGDLPDHEQGSYALIVAGDAGALLRMPETEPEANLLDRHIEATLNNDGSIAVSVNETADGQAAVWSRKELHYTARPDYTKRIEEWVSHSVSGATLSKIEPADDQKDDRFTLAVDFAAEKYAQIMQGRLLIFKPAIVSRRNSLTLTATLRRQPIVLETSAYKEDARIKLPAGFAVDELPDPVKLDAKFGSYTATYQVKDGYLLFQRSLVLKASMIPAADYQSVRTFFERIRSAEQNPAVLARN